jgi:hypothetical protein
MSRPEKRLPPPHDARWKKSWGYQDTLGTGAFSGHFEKEIRTYLSRDRS